MKRFSNTSIAEALKIGAAFVLVITLALLDYSQVFRVNRWGDNYLSKKSLGELIANPSAHVAPIIHYLLILASVMTLFLLSGFTKHWKSKK
jgi:hypothetical protein